jgi:HEAT repeat protein
MVPGDHHSCCWNSGFGPGCGLEGNRGAAVQPPAAAGPVRLEGPAYVVILFRVEQKAIGKIRTFSEDCELDAGGLTVHWLTGVQPAQSLAWLQSFAVQPDSGVKEQDRRPEGAVGAIALHADPGADPVLESFVSLEQPEALRQHTAFWLGSARGRRGYEVLRQMLRADPSDRVRDKAVFGLSVSKEPEALGAMIETARGDKSPHVRGQALFWLAHKAGDQAIGAITAAIANDPETEVKKRAVFALSQLPKDQGVPLLIEVARSNRNPVVRKQAIFWLGQSRDPRALDYFEQILSR